MYIFEQKEQLMLSLKNGCFGKLTKYFGPFLSYGAEISAPGYKELVCKLKFL